MLNQTMYQLGAVRSGIRELFEYGLQQAALCGKENVFDSTAQAKRFTSWARMASI